MFTDLGVTLARPAPSPTMTLKIALLGAESTGKTQLALAMAAHLRGQGRRVAVVEEVLREWCAREGRVPRPQEQQAIAEEQEHRVDSAALTADVVIADTTSLMVAIYSGMLFKDGLLYGFALDRLYRYDHLLLTGLDLPWVADGLQRSGPQVREPVDALIREALASAGVRYQVIYGTSGERLAAALRAIGANTSAPAGDQVPSVSKDRTFDATAWQAHCERCGDGRCEHRLFTGLL